MFEDNLWRSASFVGIIVSLVLAVLILNKLNKKGNKSGLGDYVPWVCLAQKQVDKDNFTPRDCVNECNMQGQNDCCDLVCDRDENGKYFNCNPIANRHCNAPL